MGSNESLRPHAIESGPSAAADTSAEVSRTDSTPAADALESHVRAESLWADTLRHLVDATAETIKHEIERALVRAGRFAGADRCYVFQYEPDHRSLCVTHEWAAPGSLSQTDALGQIDETVLPGFLRTLSEGEEVYVPDVSRLGPDARIERVVLTAHGVESTVLVPMMYRGEFIGFVGFDATERVRYWTQAHRRTLRFVADVFAGALGRVHTERRNAVLGSALEKSPTGVAIFSIDGTVEWLNPAFERVSGHGHDELTKRTSRTRPFGLGTTEQLNQMLSTVLAGGTWHHDLDLANASGAPVRLRLSMFAVDAEDSEAGRIVALTEDLTDELAHAPRDVAPLAAHHPPSASRRSTRRPKPDDTQLTLEALESAPRPPDASGGPGESVATGPSEASPGRPKGRPKGRGLRVLVADGSDDSARIAKAFLGPVAEVIDSADNGLDALDLARTGAYDLVLMDMQMPGMDGYAATEAIRSLPDAEAADTPIVALTSYALAEEIGRAIAAGCDGYVTKPIRRAELSRIVERYARARI